MLTSMQHIRLLSGYDMPLVGIGTYKVTGLELIKKILNEGLSLGYRSIDTGAVYGNEQSIGTALKELLPKYNLKREDIFLTSKLGPIDNGNPEKIHKSIAKSLKELNTSYLDLYLIHWPGVTGKNQNQQDNPVRRIDTWKTLIELKKKGSCKSIGVSNFTVKHLEHLLENFDVKPDVNQVECHPHFRQDELINFCKKHGIHVQAYSSLGANDNTKLLKDPVVTKIATELNVSSAKVLLKWATQQGIGIIPKTTKIERMKDNIQLDNFEINVDQMKLLSNLEQKKYTWNPENVI